MFFSLIQYYSCLSPILSPLWIDVIFSGNWSPSMILKTLGFPTLFVDIVDTSLPNSLQRFIVNYICGIVNYISNSNPIKWIRVFPNLLTSSLQFHHYVVVRFSRPYTFDDIWKVEYLIGEDFQLFLCEESENEQVKWQINGIVSDQRLCRRY